MWNDYNNNLIVSTTHFINNGSTDKSTYSLLVFSSSRIWMEWIPVQIRTSECAQAKYNMPVSETKKLFETFIGLEFCGVGHHSRCSNLLVPVFVSVLMISFLLSITLGLVFNEHKGFDETSISVCGIFGVLTSPLIYWHLLINYGRICVLTDNLLDIVDRNCEEEQRIKELRSCSFILSFPFPQQPNRRLHEECCTRRHDEQSNCWWNLEWAHCKLFQ